MSETVRVTLVTNGKVISGPVDSNLLRLSIREQGGIEEVVRAYEGNDAGDHVRTIIEELERERAERDGVVSNGTAATGAAGA